MSSAHEHLTYAERAALGLTAGDLARAGQELAPHRERASERRPVLASRRDAFNLLAYAAAFDGRERGEHEAQAWLDALGPHQIAIADARAAIAAYFNGPNRHRWITPGDVLELVEEGT